MGLGGANRQKATRKAKLTKSTVDALVPSAKRYMTWDTELPGFGVEVLPSGAKSFRFMYRPQRSRRLRNMTLGRLGALTPDEARKLARRIAGDVANGKDPAGQIMAERRMETLAEAFERWMSSHVETKRKPTTIRGYRHIWDRHIERALGRVPVAAVTRADVAALHRKLAGVPYQGNRAVAVLRSFFSWAEQEGLRPPHTNPARDVDFYRERKRERILGADELARLGVAMTEMESEARQPRDLQLVFGLAAVRLLLFTGARRGEIVNLKWSAVDLKAGTARLSDSKTGAKTLYLSAPARAVLEKLERIPGNPHVICGSVDGKPLVGLPKIWERIRRRAGLDDLRLHDLRHHLASTAAMSGMPLLTIGRLLGHSQPAVTDRYAHFASSPLVAAADAVALLIAEQLGGSGHEVEDGDAA